MAQALDIFHKSRVGQLVFGIIELALAYLFGSLAVNSGSLWEWFLTIVFLIGFLQDLIKLIMSMMKRGRIGV